MYISVAILLTRDHAEAFEFGSNSRAQQCRPQSSFPIGAYCIPFCLQDF